MRRIVQVIKFILNEPSNGGEKVKRLFLGIGWQIWKRVVKKPVVIKLDNGTNYICFPDTVMGSFPIYAKIFDSDKIL